MISFLSFLKRGREFSVLTLLLLWGVGLFSYANTLFPENITQKTDLEKKSIEKKCAKYKEKQIRTC